MKLLLSAGLMLPHGASNPTGSGLTQWADSMSMAWRHCGHTYTDGDPSTCPTVQLSCEFIVIQSMDLTLDCFDTYSTSTEGTSASRSRRKSSVIPGISIHSAIHATTATAFQDTLISFLSYIKTQNIPIFPVTKPDIRTVLGQGASFLVNGVELPRDYVDPATGTLFHQGEVLAFKRAILGRDMSDPISDRIRVIFNELLTTCHPPLRSHPNIVKLHGIAFETEGPAHALNCMPVLVPECAELGNLAEILETARKEDRAIEFQDKLSLCIDIAHGLEILHACGKSSRTYGGIL